MLELHKYKHVDWKPSPVVALATSVDGTAIAAGRGNGSIEIWVVSPGSVGWHCELTIPGKKDASVSCLLWCPSRFSKRGRLFSSGLDGLIAEWDLQMLQIKEVLNSYGGSVWQMALEPLDKISGHEDGACAMDSSDQDSAISTDDISDSEDYKKLSMSSDHEDFQGGSRVAVGCDDGCVRLFTVNDGESFLYRKSFPRVQGRILAVSWSSDGRRVISGGSDGCIRCWDARHMRELYRITVGLGGAGNGSSLCIWSILVLRDGTIVSGDSSGSTQFWDGIQGTLLQAHTGHKADVLALAASPNHHSVFAAGADGQVVQYQFVPESKVLADSVRTNNIGIGVALGSRWVFVGSKRNHTHDVNALVVACPPVSEDLDKKSKPRSERKKLKKPWSEQGQKVSAGAGVIPMLVSGGNDAKLFTYPANAFLAFHAHDICFAPQRTPISLALRVNLQHGLIMMAQHEHQVEIWKVTINASNKQVSSTSLVNPSTVESPTLPGKRKMPDGSGPDSKRRMANGHLTKGKSRTEGSCNGQEIMCNDLTVTSSKGRVKGSPPELLARIKCKAAENIICSAISDTGNYIAISDQSRPRLYELEQQCPTGTSGPNAWCIKKRALPPDIPSAHCMIFCGSSLLLLAVQGIAVWVVDIESTAVIHKFALGRDPAENHDSDVPPLTSMCASSDQKWLAIVNSRGFLSVFNLEAFRLHWNVPPLDGNYVTSICFQPGDDGILSVTMNSNVLYMLDVNTKKFCEWSKKNSHRLPRSFLEFPGGVQRLSFCPSAKSKNAVAYSSKAICLIDFEKPVPQDHCSTSNDVEKSHLSNGVAQSGKVAMALENGGHAGSSKNFIIVPFKNPVLFVGYVMDKSLLVVEKPWLEAVEHLPPPVYRHLYGT
ncbi:hypothetical protein KP509_12G068700 [Ceratopteris richardii]|uniref:Uncharacterized protein n=1 Tax=Ceratopteris richardii TaxID=49495 RepID=A0A8T2TK17_CERRI|nr:hypothetical protein KP509_12G068700 [Ceratopteris richardii]